MPLDDLSAFSRALLDFGLDSDAVELFDELLIDDDIDDLVDEILIENDEQGQQLDELQIRELLEDNFEEDDFSFTVDFNIISGPVSRVVIYKTQRDSKVDDIICLPLEGEHYRLDSDERPIIPDDTHPNCRCYYEDAITGENLGQI